MRAALVLASVLGGGGAAFACREGQPAIEPRPEPDSPLPRIQRPEERTPRSGDAPESSGPNKPSAAPVTSSAPPDAGPTR